MDQVKIGSFLKELRKDQNLTQENLAEQLNVSNRTISRWETGNNMPDISMLIVIADFYDVSIPEIIDGERKGENMNQETRDTAIKMAKYSQNEVKTGKQKVIGFLMSVFGIFIIVSALAIFPNDSSWGSIYSVFGSIIMIIGVYFITKSVLVKRNLRMLSVIGCVILLFGIFTISDYLAVTQFNQVPRFSYEKSYSSVNPDEIIHKTLFYTAVQKNIGTEYERVEIIK
ncbi:MAG: helix-turn-helix transcriptional regulator [Clostridiales bacterium]|nr:helix-turn-helix transcriptional regulator [Clostridiales bacterium]NLL72743.1 helix-turn-helix transcriptional regulator [Clostridiales bacterium]